MEDAQEPVEQANMEEVIATQETGLADVHPDAIAVPPGATAHFPTPQPRAEHLRLARKLRGA